MVIIKKFDVMSLAKIQGVLMALMGIIIGLFYAIFGTVMSVFAGAGGLAGFGILSIIIFPILYGVIGFVGGALSAFIYNFVADKIGGIEMELEK